jgi:secondary thiamine-phosphate synthase enzyme
MILQHTFTVHARGRGFTNVTDEVQRVVSQATNASGLCNVFIQHTSASLIISENADPAVGRDLERFLSRLVPDGDPLFEHDAEGPDDMPAHVRSVLTASSLIVPVTQGSLMLGTWQGIYLWEHRHGQQQRRIVVTIQT